MTETGMSEGTITGVVTLPPEPEATAGNNAPDEAIEEVAEISLSTPAFSFRGQFPDVPFAKGVDISKLTEGDDKPLYVVRPLAVINAVSDNDLEYDRELVDEIRKQVHTKKPPARQGHVPRENINWEFPDDVGLWVGAEMFGDTLFGKCYIYPRTTFHQMVTKRKAAGSTLSNSIWGEGRWIVKSNGNKGLRGLELESIDFAPAERASLQALGGDFDTASEMSTDLKEHGEKEMSDEKKDTTPISEMEADKVCEMLSADQRKFVAKKQVSEMEPSAVYEMLSTEHRQGVHDCYVKEFGQKEPTAEMKNINSQLAEMKTKNEAMEKTIAEFNLKEFNERLDKAAAQPFETWQVRSDENKKAVESARETVKKLIVAEMATMDGGSVVENIAGAAEKAWATYEPQAAALKRSFAGGSVITGLVSEQKGPDQYGYDPKTGRYDEKVAANARATVMGG